MPLLRNRIVLAATLYLILRSEAGNTPTSEARSAWRLSTPDKPRALLRRAKAQAAPERKKLKEIQIENLKLNLDSHQAFCGAEQIHLTPSEFKLLQTLAMEAGKVFTREALIQEVQGMGVSVVDRAIDTHVFGLRKKLGDCANVLETVRGIGYRVKPPETN